MSKLSKCFRTFFVDGFSDQDLEVKITHGIAKELHTLWAATLQARFDEEQKQMEQMITAGNGRFILEDAACG